MSHGSVRTQRPVAASWVHRGRPRRVSSIPSTVVGSGSPRLSAAASITAACAVGQDTANAPATSETLRHASATAAAIPRRIRPVVRRPAGISAMTCVNDPRAHAGWTQRHRCLCQTTEISPSP